MISEERKRIVQEVLEGLAVGDALGEAFSYRSASVRQRAADPIPSGPFWYTDDTAMALGVVECLQRAGGIAEDMLAAVFARNYRRDPDRGYGKMARLILNRIAAGEDWAVASETAFQGGSMGNGAAMRVPPLGIWFADDLDRLETEAWKSARVTHWHPEGIAGAVAVAVATAMAMKTREESLAGAREAIAAEVMRRTPASETRERIALALRYDFTASNFEVARRVGNSSLVTAPDTVPFVIWAALRSLDDYREGFFTAVEVNGDCDTNAAMAGAIITARLGIAGIPEDWLANREPLPVLPAQG